jgi:serine/threonine-protein kinase
VFVMPSWRLFDGGLFAGSRTGDANRSRPAVPGTRGAQQHGGTAGPAASTAPSSDVSAGPAASVQLGTGGSGRRMRPDGVYGPWQCPDTYSWDVGHPVLAKPCHSLGGGIRLIGHMQALPGVQADVTLTLLDVATGETAAGPYGCAALMFTDTASEHSCGPFEVAVAHGHRYVVVEKWQYTGRGILPTGATRGVEFAW